MLNTRCNRIFSLGTIVITLLLLTIVHGELAVARSQGPKSISESMQHLTNKQVVDALSSSNSEEASQAVQEVMRRGTSTIPFLMKNKGNKQQFKGGGLGHPKAAQFILEPTGDRKFDEGRVITIEITSLYLISSIYYGTLKFAQSPYLTDMSLPAVKRRAFNSRNLIKRAWKATEAWNLMLQIEGLEALRKKQQDPLRRSTVSFW